MIDSETTLIEQYKNSKLLSGLTPLLGKEQCRIHIKGIVGSLTAVAGAALAASMPENNFLFIALSKENAYYLQNDLETLLGETGMEMDKKRVLLFPTTYRRAYQYEETENANVLMRSEVIRQLNAGRRLVLVSYPEALAEKVISARTLTKNTLQIIKGTQLDMDFVIEVLQDYDFDRVDFVVQPGQYAVRGGIIDVFSFANEQPFRIEFFDDTIDSLRSFDPVSQLSIRQYDKITIIPNLETHHDNVVNVEEKVNLLQYFCSSDIVWATSLMQVCESIEKCYATACN